MIRRMSFRRRPLMVALFVCLAASLLGCAAPLAPSPPPPAEFADNDAENMFKAGLAAIVDRYVDPLPAETITIEGLRGLSDLDAALASAKVHNEIDLERRGRLVATEPTPRARDVDGWAKLTVRVWREARAASPQIAAASQESVYEAFFRRATAMLDANSRYASAAEAKRHRQRRDGYRGIGVRVAMTAGEALVVEVGGRGPGERAGLRVGDVLTQIDGRPTAGLSSEEVMARLQEDTAGWVRLNVRRPGHGLQQFVVLRNYLLPETVHQRYEDGILYLAIDRFSQGTADAVEADLAQFAGEFRTSLRGVVLDLRGNPGGLLHQAVKVADLFLSHGPILSTRGRNPESVQDFVAGGADLIHGLPLVVLVDGETASAAELAAAALDDRGRAVIIGSTSYGKGTVQTVVPMPNGGELSFTWSHAVLPSGVDMRDGGVRPGLCTSGLYVLDEDVLDRLVAGEERSAAGPGGGCPAERRDGEVDPEVARRLVEQPERWVAALRGEAMVAEVPARPGP